MLTPPPGHRPERPYHPRLDGLRGLAILAVLAEHLVWSEAVTAWSPGMIGVRTFFVLSGFLITSILVGQRGGSLPRWKAAATFFMRRALRLWPAYYLAIALAALFGIAEMRSHWPAHALYVTNFLVAHDQRWIGAGHFWTLSVEEQFYLLWFPMVVLAPRKWLLPVVVGALAAAPLYRMSIPLGASEFSAVLLPGQIDSFATGALLVLCMHRPGLRPIDRVIGRPAILWTSVAAVVLLSIPAQVGYGSPVLDWVLMPVLVNIAAACLVRACVTSSQDFTVVLQRPWLVHVGRISYGLYIYHYFMPQILTTDRLGLAAASGLGEVATLAIVWITASFIAAEISWRLVEKPALRLKSAVSRPGVD
ncbi:MAG: acyltransferase family protein [Brevundimonas sp.]|uniref:acyltransferase family protein n=1 Tax=Brevundimonas sp. TaxID=1871086 RepID=UPI0039189441